MMTIIPITELRNTNEIAELAHSRKEPIFITKNGYGSLVLMSMEAYQLREEMMDLREKLMEAHIKHEAGIGKTYTFEEVDAEITKMIEGIENG
ncbi:MAG: type II toxin-antitoxin system Phd/YefM family antitoxin [Defluviitaleaceae bacterium]|nr:type II toxin-antitoxin system Phd/YefM family antitoxin [Defluviitaleaceae bacterium]